MTSGYEKSLNTASWFFTLLVGLSLTHILDQESTLNPPPFFVNRGLLFVIGGLLFLRYLTGSAVHLWYEYSRPEKNLDHGAFQRDFYFLLVFGSLGVLAFYQNTLSDFLVWISVLVGSALLWGLWNWWRNRRENRPSPWNYWIKFNAIQISSLIAALYLSEKNPTSIASLYSFDFLPDVLSWFPTLSIWLTLVAIIFLACLVYDIKQQIRILAPSTPSTLPLKTDRSP